MATLYAVGLMDDPHILTVLGYVRELGVEAVLIPSWNEDPSRMAAMSWRSDCGWSLEPSSAIWLRNKHTVPSVKTVADQEDWWRLSNTLAFSSAAGASSPLLFNRMRNAAATDAKIPQLQTAQACGFDIPATLVSNHKATIAEFVERHGVCIVKPLVSASMPAINGDLSTVRFLPTVTVSLEDIAQADDLSFLTAHNIYQQRIEKIYELRTIAFRDEVISFKIDSQSHPFTKVDWRAGERLLSCEQVDTPSAILEPIQNFLKLTGLDSSVFDFAVTPDGEAVFFESNPAGQWRRMDMLNGDVVSRMFARQMVKAIRERYGPSPSLVVPSLGGGVVAAPT